MVNCRPTLKQHGGFLVESWFSLMVLMIMRLASANVIDLKAQTPNLGDQYASH